MFKNLEQLVRIGKCCVYLHSLDTQKVVIAVMCSHCAFKKQSTFGFIFPLAQNQPIRQVSCFQSV